MIKTACYILALILLIPNMFGYFDDLTMQHVTITCTSALLLGMSEVITYLDKK